MWAVVEPPDVAGSAHAAHPPAHGQPFTHLNRPTPAPPPFPPPHPPSLHPPSPVLSLAHYPAVMELLRPRARREAATKLVQVRGERAGRRRGSAPAAAPACLQAAVGRRGGRAQQQRPRPASPTSPRTPAAAARSPPGLAPALLLRCPRRRCRRCWAATPGCSSWARWRCCSGGRGCGADFVAGRDVCQGAGLSSSWAGWRCCSGGRGGARGLCGAVHEQWAASCGLGLGRRALCSGGGG